MNLLQHHKAFAALAMSFSLWASSALAETPAIPNFHQVDEHVYRGGQPATETWQSLAKLGIKTVIDLRREDEHSTAAEARDVAAAGMNYVNVPMKGVVAPTNEQIAKVLQHLNSQEPVFVHCKKGSGCIALAGALSWIPKLLGPPLGIQANVDQGGHRHPALPSNC